jgi:thymidylate synthase
VATSQRGRKPQPQQAVYAVNDLTAPKSTEKGVSDESKDKDDADKTDKKKPNKFSQARARRRGPQHAVESIVHFAISQITMQQPTQEELQYLGLVRDILENGERRPDRTGTGTLSIFAPRPLKFQLQENGRLVLPLLTTKRVFHRAVVAELLWFIRGSTSSLPLSEAGVRIWDGNGSREFLDSVGLSHRDVGDLGPIYGFQWRHFGADYVDASADYAGQGVDQLANIIHTLRTNPYDRRMILSAWNPRDLKIMALPPCHMFAQFYVSFPKQGQPEGSTEAKAKGHLHCQMYQRSCDMGLGVPFNIASYALLTHMLARVCDLVPGSLTLVMGDAHVYIDHIDALKTQLEREPRTFPELEIKCEKGGSIDGWKAEDFVIKGYDPHKAIAMKMAV